MLIMVTGVSGSGKSEYAEQISCQLAKDNKKYYVATMYPYGEDGRSRVKKPITYLISFSSNSKCGIGILEYIENAITNDLITDITDIPL